MQIATRSCRFITALPRLTAVPIGIHSITIRVRTWPIRVEAIRRVVAPILLAVVARLEAMEVIVRHLHLAVDRPAALSGWRRQCVLDR